MQRPGRVFTRDELLERVWGRPWARALIARSMRTSRRCAPPRAVRDGEDPIRTLRGVGMRCVRGELGALSAGNPPRRANLLSFAPPKESRQRKGGPTGRVPFGAVRDARAGGKQPNSLRSLRSLRSNSGSESEHEARMLRCAPAPRPALLGTARRGLKMDRAIAALGLSSSTPLLRAAVLSPPWERVG